MFCNPAAIHQAPVALGPHQFAVNHVFLVKGPTVLGKAWTLRLVNQASFTLTPLGKVEPGSVGASSEVVAVWEVHLFLSPCVYKLPFAGYLVKEKNKKS